ncbi:lipoprotein LpqH [Mycolicibacterium sp. XJ662]
MHNPIAVIAAAVLMISTGCSSGVNALGEHLLHLRVNENDVGAYPVHCSQVQWLWRLETLEQTPGVVAQVNTEDSIEALSVQINNLGGFTGTYWEGTTGEADASLVDGKFTITGTAVGFFHDDPGERTSAPFEINTEC